MQGQKDTANSSESPSDGLTDAEIKAGVGPMREKHKGQA
jgi:hypothetical protein